MRDLKVPYALNEAGQVVAALTAPKASLYTCLECLQPLTLRRRRDQRPHFMHHAATLQNCTGESATHLAAKHLLKEQLEQELAEHGAVVYQLPCPGVDGRCRDYALHTHRLELVAWDAVELEVAHQGFRFDVAVTSGGEAVIGLEVFFRHEVPDEKAAALSVPWLELLAEDILAFKPRVPWRSPVAARRCEACEALAVRLAKRDAEDKQRDKVKAEFRAEAERVGGAWRAVLGRAQGRRA